MNSINPRVLYSVDPRSERLARLIREKTATAVRLYWELFVSLPISIISFLVAVITIVVCVVATVQHPDTFLHNLPPIGLALAFLAYRRVREFSWALLGCLVFWILLVALLLLPFVGPDFKVVTTTTKILLGVAYLLPPFIAALYIDHARHRQA